MATVYKQIKDGKLTEDQVLSKDVDTLNEKFNIDPDSAELTNGTITLTVGAALNQMITISHNYAVLLLTQKVKLSPTVSYQNIYLKEFQLPIKPARLVILLTMQE